MKYPIENDCLYVYIDGNSGKKLMPKFLLQVSVQELHNSMVSCPEEGGPKNQYMNTTILSSVIQHYEIFFHANSKI